MEDIPTGVHYFVLGEPEDSSNRRASDNTTQWRWKHRFYDSSSKTLIISHQSLVISWIPAKRKIATAVYGCLHYIQVAMGLPPRTAREEWWSYEGFNVVHYSSLQTPPRGILGFSEVFKLFMKRSLILDSNILVGRALVIDIEVQFMSKSRNFRPPNPFASNMLKLLENGDDADVVFKIEDTLIPAHKLALFWASAKNRLVWSISIPI